MGIRTVAPCVNAAQALFSVQDGAIVYGLGALKNVGVEAMRMIVAARGDRPFADLADLARRADLKRIGKRPLEMLARAGAFDELDPNRRRVFEALDALVAYSAAVHEGRASAQVSLFGEAGEDLPEPRVAPVEDWLPGERLAEEHKAVGFYLSGHPLDDYMGALKRKGIQSFAEVQRQAERAPAVARIAGTVACRQERKNAKGTRYGFVGLSDPTGLFEAMVFSDVLDASRDQLEPGMNVVLTVEATAEGEQLRLLARSVAPIDTVVADAAASGLRVFVDRIEAVASVASLLDRARREVSTRARGPVMLCLMAPDLPGEVEVTVGEDLPVASQVRGALKSLGGVVTVEDL